MSLSVIVFLAHCASTLALVGLIWIVQILVYPQYLNVSADCFPKFHRAHMKRITFIVAPLMLVELVSTVATPFFPNLPLPSWIAWTCIACVAVCWGSTAWVQVPIHDRLIQGHAQAHVKTLVLSNWIRTAAWSLHGLLLLCGLAQLLSTSR